MYWGHLNDQIELMGMEICQFGLDCDFSQDKTAGQSWNTNITRGRHYSRLKKGMGSK